MVESVKKSLSNTIQVSLEEMNVPLNPSPEPTKAATEVAGLPPGAYNSSYHPGPVASLRIAQAEWRFLGQT